MLTDEHRKLLEDKVYVWTQNATTGNMDLRDYNRRCAEALTAALASKGEALPVVSEEMVDALDWFGAHRNLELSFDHGDAEDYGNEWCVHRVNGGVNDREWTLVGSGSTPSAAISNAFAKAALLSRGEG